MIKILYFSAPWCGPCKQLSPIMDEIKLTHSDKVQIEKIDVDSNPEMSMKYNVSSIPTLVYLRNDVVISRTSGFIPKNEIIKNIDFLNK